MPITLTCPSCGQPCAVKEEYAGMQVRCPRCPGVITVPATGAVPVATAAIVEPEDADVPVAMSAPVPPPIRAESAAASFVNKATGFLAANGVTGVNQILLLVGLGCLALFLITILLPWSPSLASFFPPGFDGAGKFEVSFGSTLGIARGDGLLYFFLTLAITFLLVFVILLNWSKLFSYSLWTTSNWSIFVALHLLLNVRYAAWGLIMALVVMLVAAGCLGVVVFSRLFSNRA
jgi:hypothetical protein